MASAYIRVKIDLPDVQAARMVRDNTAGTKAPTAKQIVETATALFMDEARESVLVQEYGAEITRAK